MQLYLRLGLKLKKIHRVLKFSQSQWLKPYIEFNAHKGIEAVKSKDKDGKASYKLMNDAAYGTAMENLGNRIDVKLVNNERDYLKCTSKPSYMSHKIFDNDLVAIRKSKIPLSLNKSAYIRMCILELIKVLMYEFYYDYKKSKLLLKDTDSLMYEIKTEDFYEGFSSDKQMFDFSNCFPKTK